MNKNARIFVAGHRGLVGGAVLRKLQESGYSNLITRTHAELALDESNQVEMFFAQEKPEYVFLAAAKVGGILANSTMGADFIRENLKIQTNVIDAAYRYGVKKLLFLGSSCIYPKLAPQPIKESALLTGPLESSNLPYAIAKIAGVEMCNAYRSQYGFDAFTVMPPNVYGEGDNFHPEHSHVIAGMMRRFHEAKLHNAPEVLVWGSGLPRREFIFADDLADACVFLMQRFTSGGLINVGVSEDISIQALASLMAKVCDYKGGVRYDTTRPDGTPRKLLDSHKLKNMGWRPQTSIQEGLEKMYAWWLTQENM